MADNNQSRLVIVGLCRLVRGDAGYVLTLPGGHTDVGAFFSLPSYRYYKPQTSDFDSPPQLADGRIP